MRTVPLVLLLSCAYEAPVDEGAAPLLNSVAGEVVYGGTGDPATTYVLVFDAANPGPPEGTGSPITLSAVPERAYDGGDGLVAAPFAVTQLPDGEYLFNALVDADGDFNPFADALAGATCGDWGGTYLQSLVSTDPATVRVKGGERVDEVTVVVGQRFDFERPVFTLVGGAPELSLAATLDPYNPVRFRLRADAVSTDIDRVPLELGPACGPGLPAPYCDAVPQCGCDTATVSPCGTALMVWVKDDDDDGIPDPYPDELVAANGIFDVWPRVYLESTAELGTFEHEGQELPERWVAEAYAMAAELGYVLLTGGDPNTVAPVGTPIAVHELSVTVSGVFVHYHADGIVGVDANGPFDLVDASADQGPNAIPEGPWTVTVVEFTGQTWTVPNETLLPTQSGALVVVP